MKVTFIITNLATGGAETMLLKLLQHMDRRSYEPTVISLVGAGEIGPQIESLGIPVHLLGMRRGVPSPLKLLALVRLLRKVKPDLVHTWMYHADLVGGLAARLAGCRKVIWGLHHSNISQEHNKRLTLFVVQVCAMLSRWLPTKILSCSVRAKCIHAEAGYQDEKIRVIPNGFELDRFHPNPDAWKSVRAELGLSIDAPLVGLVARYDPQKNHLGFIRAAALVCANLPEVRFVLAGFNVDAHNAELCAEISAHSIQKYVHLLGVRSDIPRIMAALDVLASASHGEAFPSVLGEAMACGVPCVVTDVGDSAEIVARTGLVVPSGDMEELAAKLITMLSLSQAEKVALGHEARKRIAAEYEINHVAGMYQSFYGSVLAE